MSIAKIFSRDTLFSGGVLLLGASFLLFCIPDLFPDHEIEPFALFCLHFVCAIAYLVVLLSSGRLRKGRSEEHTSELQSL